MNVQVQKTDPVSCVSLEYPASGERQDRTEAILAKNSGHVGDEIHSSAMDPLREMDGRKSRYIKEVLDCYRKEDA